MNRLPCPKIFINWRKRKLFQHISLISHLSLFHTRAWFAMCKKNQFTSTSAQPICTPEICISYSGISSSIESDFCKESSPIVETEWLLSVVLSSVRTDNDLDWRDNASCLVIPLSSRASMCVSLSPGSETGITPIRLPKSYSNKAKRHIRNVYDM